eukprot:TRINITY_DN2061_c0_g1_i5.p1 TRINITY_DN2061_c0_g1~~TRINITY_DN2061_c0_g1_i5.p1  ORF type:complete len:1560 (+),score=298.90 TRINITY_DN2061_c0_g1_i5:61-4680(+)
MMLLAPSFCTDGGVALQRLYCGYQFKKCVGPGGSPPGVPPCQSVCTAATAVCNMAAMSAQADVLSPGSGAQLTALTTCVAYPTSSCTPFNPLPTPTRTRTRTFQTRTKTRQTRTRTLQVTRTRTRTSNKCFPLVAAAAGQKNCSTWIAAGTPVFNVTSAQQAAAYANLANLALLGSISCSDGGVSLMRLYCGYQFMKCVGPSGSPPGVPPCQSVCLAVNSSCNVPSMIATANAVQPGSGAQIALLTNCAGYPTSSCTPFNPLPTPTRTRTRTASRQTRTRTRTQTRKTRTPRPLFSGTKTRSRTMTHQTRTRTRNLCFPLISAPPSSRDCTLWIPTGVPVFNMTSAQQTATYTNINSLMLVAPSFCTDGGVALQRLSCGAAFMQCVGAGGSPPGIPPCQSVCTAATSVCNMPGLIGTAEAVSPGSGAVLTTLTTCAAYPTTSCAALASLQTGTKTRSRTMTHQTRTATRTATRETRTRTRTQTHETRTRTATAPLQTGTPTRTKTRMTRTRTRAVCYTLNPSTLPHGCSTWLPSGISVFNMTAAQQTSTYSSINSLMIIAPTYCTDGGVALQRLACGAAFMQCVTGPPGVPPCQSICTAATAVCNIAALITTANSISPGSGSVLTAMTTCSRYPASNCNPLTGSSLPTPTPVSHCKPYSPGHCSDNFLLPVTMSVYDRTAAQQNQGQAAIQNISPLIYLYCPGSKQVAMRALLCGVVAPECSPAGGTTYPRAMCRSLCEEANANCPGLLEYLQTTNPQGYATLSSVLNCAQYPTNFSTPAPGVAIPCDTGAMLPFPFGPPPPPPVSLSVSSFSVRLLRNQAVAEVSIRVSATGGPTARVRVLGRWEFVDNSAPAYTAAVAAPDGWVVDQANHTAQPVARFCIISLESGATVSVLPAPRCATPTYKPNVVLMFIDDLGYGDLGSYNSAFSDSPRIDAMADAGIRFTQWISASAICTPSRAALLTGRLPLRSGMDGTAERVLISPAHGGGLPHEEITIAEVLRDAGYKTTIYGKWHLGVNRNTSGDGYWLPTNQGFESFWGIPFSNGPFCGANNPSPFRALMCFNMQDNVVVEQPMNLENSTGRLTQQAMWTIDEAQAEHRPFFLFLSYLHVRTAIFTQPQFAGLSPRGPIGDAVRELDWSVGTVLDHLSSSGLAEDTLVLFISDNGGFNEVGVDAGSNGGLRGGKGQIWEGGIRVPAIAYWPGQIAPAQTYTEPVSTMDVFPTILSIAGLTAPADRIIDGKDIWPILVNGSAVSSPHDSMFHYCGAELAAMRQGQYKIVFQKPVWTNTSCQCCPEVIGGVPGVCGCSGSSVVVLTEPEVYDMDADPFEINPLTSSNFADWATVLAAANASLTAHLSTMTYGEPQLAKYYRMVLQPACPGQNPITGNFSCSINFPITHQNPTPVQMEATFAPTRTRTRTGAAGNIQDGHGGGISASQKSAAVGSTLALLFGGLAAFGAFLLWKKRNMRRESQMGSRREMSLLDLSGKKANPARPTGSLHLAGPPSLSIHAVSPSSTASSPARPNAPPPAKPDEVPQLRFDV